MSTLVSNYRRKCYHCDGKFHSEFCRRLIIRNGRIKKILSSKYECLTCHKRFREIANFLLHRTLHESPHLQNGGNNNITIATTPNNDSAARDLFESERIFETSEIDNYSSPEMTRSNLEADPVMTAPSNEGKFRFPSSKKALQPTGARKRKGGLQQQCKLLDFISTLCLI